MNGKRSIELVGAFALVLAMAVPVAAIDKVTATLDGKAISLERAGTLSCHDYDYPRITCFATPAALQSAVVRRAAGPDRAPGSAPVGSAYVIVYEHASFAGANMVLSADQPWLSSVGWNDRISSFKSFGATGSFREHSPSGGLVYSFGRTTQIASLSGTYNDKFSAFYID